MSLSPQQQQTAQAALELIRRKSKSDLYYFDREVLGYKQMAPEPHLLMCSSVMNGGRKQLHLWPRGHFKSSVITIGYTLHRITQDPNIRVLIANATLQNAKTFLREIKGHLEKNTTLRLAYGDLTNKQDKWTETEIIVSNRTKNLKEPTILAAGVGQSLTGLHFDLIIGDDIVNYDSVNTPEQIDKTRRWWGDAMSLLEPDGQAILIGTRYHYADLYGSIIETMSDEYNPQVHAAISKDTPLFPSRFSREKLKELKREQGSYMFSAQYLNSPVDDESAKFKKDWIKYEPALPDRQYYTTMVVDRAYSLAKTADYTSFTVKKQDLDGFWHIVLALRGRFTEGEIVKKIFDLKNHFNVDLIGIEQLAFDSTLKPVLDEEMRRRNDFFEVIELRGRSSKIARIEGLVPRFESGSVYFVGDPSEYIDIVDEMLRFPLAQHDDLIDGLAYHNDEDMVGGVSSKSLRVYGSPKDPVTGYRPKQSATMRQFKR